MNWFIALLDNVPRRSRAGNPVVFRDRLPNGIPYMATHPENLDFMIGAAKEKSELLQTTVSVVIIDLREILESDWVSPDSVEGLPDWVSTN